ncbi:MAG TPA: glycerophosphodiester phosphodiesterase [Alphaproteobacteria bacterium]
MPGLSIPRIIGHRGAKATAPENTLAGIRQAKREGAAWVEIDVRLTADGHPVLMHDETLDRTTSGRGPVRVATLDEIKRLDGGVRFGPAWEGEPVPTLVEALAVFAELDLGFNLEIKPCPGRETETARIAVDVVRQLWSADRPVPVISSFSEAALMAARTAAPALPRGYLVKALPAAWKQEVEQLDCATVHVSWRKLTPTQVRAVKAAGLPLLVWTVNEVPRARALLSWGVDGVITDCPARLAGL